MVLFFLFSTHRINDTVRRWKMPSYDRSGIKKSRPVTFRAVTYPSINAFAKWARAQGYKTDFGTIRSGLDHNRDLEEVLSGKKYERCCPKNAIVYKGVEYASTNALFRALYKKNKKVYICQATFRYCVKTKGLDVAVHRLLHPRITNCSISRRLGGPDNLVLLRLKHGWSRYRATHEKCQKKNKKSSASC